MLGQTFEYTVRHGRIVDNGPFQDQPRYAPYYYARLQAVGADMISDDTALFWIDADMYKLFQELQPFTLVALYITNQKVNVIPLSHLDIPN